MAVVADAWIEERVRAMDTVLVASDNQKSALPVDEQMSQEVS